jgi:predicted AAA+ superfamily ATPase
MLAAEGLYPRRLEASIREARTDTPVILVVGPRQAGKTTLVRQIAEGEMDFLSLDDELSRRY